MKNLQTFRVSLHGHSPESDGLSSIHELVMAAGKAKIDYFGLADHETTSGIPTLYREVAWYNAAYGKAMQAVAGFEVNFADSGDVIFSKPGPLDRQFLAWGERIIAKRKTYPCVRAINEAVKRFGAIVTLAHVGAPLVNSISIDRLSGIVRKLDRRVVKNVCLEVKNYATRIFAFHTFDREQQLAIIAHDLNLATVGFSDFHSAWMVDQQVSAASFEELDGKPRTIPIVRGKGLVKAVQRRTIAPLPIAAQSVATWLRLLWVIARSFVIFKQKYNGWFRFISDPTPQYSSKSYSLDV